MIPVIEGALSRLATDGAVTDRIVALRRQRFMANHIASAVD
jgi:hypothetical protein